MAFPKNALFPPDDQALSRIGLVLSHPARLFIARMLLREGPKYVLELEQCMPLVQASISHHLKKMREAGIVEVEEHQLYNRYHIDSHRLHEVVRMFEAWYDDIECKPLDV